MAIKKISMHENTIENPFLFNALSIVINLDSDA